MASRPARLLNRTAEGSTKRQPHGWRVVPGGWLGLNANLKWRELPLMERHAYCERLSKLQGKEIGTSRVADWTLFYSYNFDETLKNKMKFEYLHSDGDVFKDYSREIALSISKDVYRE
ncbi:hypothetical protein Tco_0073529 [Tanacetum coccineum]